MDQNADTEFDGEMRYSFGGIEFDPISGDIQRGEGRSSRLRPQASKVLELLARADGDLVSRESIRTAVWADAVVEFDAAINACLREIRQALGDSAKNPRFIETLPRRGYRLLLPVERREKDRVDHHPGNLSGGRPSPTDSKAPRSSLRQGSRRRVMIAITTLVVGGIGWLLGTRTSGPSARPPTVAVLPFVNASLDPLGDTIAAILSDRLASEMARVDPGRLAVLASNSSRRLGALGDPLPEVAGTLGLDFVVEGTVSKDADFELDLRLIDPASATQAWARRYRVSPSLLSLTVDSAFRDAARAMGPGIGEGALTVLLDDGQSRGSRESLLRARFLLARHTMAATHRADTLLAAALSEHPDGADLRVARAEVARRLGRTAEAESEARELLAEPYASAAANRILGRIAMGRHDWASARSSLESAIELSPNDAQALQLAAFLFAYVGEPDRSVAMMRRALLIDPISSALIADAGMIFLWAGQYQEAETQCVRALDLEPSLGQAHRCVVEAAWHRGRPQLGETAARHLLDTAGWTPRPGESAVDSYWRMLIEASGQDGCAPLARARAMIAVGRTEEAVDVVRQVEASAPSCLTTVAADPFFADLRHVAEVRRALSSIDLES